jgi:transcriptional regulator with XRE-family HTH domain
MNANKNLCGKRVKMARIDKEMTQIDLSAALSVDVKMEISQKALSRLEKGQRLVRDIELVALADILEVPIEWLLFGKAEQAPSKK